MNYRGTSVGSAWIPEFYSSNRMDKLVLKSEMACFKLSVLGFDAIGCDISVAWE
jgi:hypothetical protein